MRRSERFKRTSPLGDVVVEDGEKEVVSRLLVGFKAYHLQQGAGTTYNRPVVSRRKVRHVKAGLRSWLELNYANHLLLLNYADIFMEMN